MKKISDHVHLLKNARIVDYHERKHEVIGNAVELPFYFIEKEDLQIKLSNKEYIVPEYSFT